MSQQQGIDRPVVVVGAGLGGSLLSLALARRGCPVELVGPANPSATGLSYGGLPPAGLGAWRQLERRHGPLGLRPSRLVLHGWPGLLRRLPPRLQALPTAILPFGQVDTPSLAAALPGVLERAGVARQGSLVRGLEPVREAGWRLLDGQGNALRFRGGRDGSEGTEVVSAVVLAAGAGCRALWPALPERLRFSWAGVIELDAAGLAAGAERQGWLEQGLRGRIVQPLHLLRPALEAGAARLREERWIVDPGLAPRGSGVVLGQITWLGADGDAAQPPDPAVMEARLRAGLAELDPQLASLSGTYRQVPVPFCLDGPPLAAPVPDTRGLWAFTGFSGAFTVVPSLAESLADRLVDSLRQPWKAGRTADRRSHGV